MKIVFIYFPTGSKIGAKWRVHPENQYRFPAKKLRSKRWESIFFGAIRFVHNKIQYCKEKSMKLKQ